MAIELWKTLKESITDSQAYLPIYTSDLALILAQQHQLRYIAHTFSEVGSEYHRYGEYVYHMDLYLLTASQSPIYVKAKVAVSRGRPK